MVAGKLSKKEQDRRARNKRFGAIAPPPPGTRIERTTKGRGSPQVTVIRSDLASGSGGGSRVTATPLGEIGEGLQNVPAEQPTSRAIRKTKIGGQDVTLSPGLKVGDKVRQVIDGREVTVERKQKEFLLTSRPTQTETPTNENVRNPDLLYTPKPSEKVTLAEEALGMSLPLSDPLRSAQVEIKPEGYVENQYTPIPPSPTTRYEEIRSQSLIPGIREFEPPKGIRGKIFELVEERRVQAELDEINRKVRVGGASRFNKPFVLTQTFLERYVQNVSLESAERLALRPQVIAAELAIAAAIGGATKLKVFKLTSFGRKVAAPVAFGGLAGLSGTQIILTPEGQRQKKIAQLSVDYATLGLGFKLGGGAAVKSVEITKSVKLASQKARLAYSLRWQHSARGQFYKNLPTESTPKVKNLQANLFGQLQTPQETKNLRVKDIKQLERLGRLGIVRQTPNTAKYDTAVFGTTKTKVQRLGAEGYYSRTYTYKTGNIGAQERISRAVREASKPVVRPGAEAQIRLTDISPKFKQAVLSPKLKIEVKRLRPPIYETTKALPKKTGRPKKGKLPLPGLETAPKISRGDLASPYFDQRLQIKYPFVEPPSTPTPVTPPIPPVDTGFSFGKFINIPDFGTRLGGGYIFTPDIKQPTLPDITPNIKIDFDPFTSPKYEQPPYEGTRPKPDTKIRDRVGIKQRQDSRAITRGITTPQIPVPTSPPSGRPPKVPKTPQPPPPPPPPPPKVPPPSFFLPKQTYQQQKGKGTYKPLSTTFKEKYTPSVDAIALQIEKAQREIRQIKGITTRPIIRRTKRR